MSMWRKTLEYLGLVEEAEEYDELPERLDENGHEVRPAMHDTTGPIEVVRVDAPGPEGRPSSRLGSPSDDRRGSRESTSGPTAEESSRLRPVGDLTEPVSVVAEDRSGRGGRRGGTRGQAGQAGQGGQGGKERAHGRSRERGAGRGEADRSAEEGNVRQLRPDAGAGMPGGMGRRVAIVAVADYEGGAREVGQRYRQAVPVVFDLTDAPVDDRRRVLDFVAGITYALHGEMVKVGRRSFLIVPEGGEVPEAEWQRLASLGYRP